MALGESPVSAAARAPSLGGNRADFRDLDDDNWKCFVNSTYNRDTADWSLKKVPWKQVVKD